MKLRILCNLLVVLLAAGQLQAVPLFSTLGPGDSYKTSGGLMIGFPGSEYDVGTPFAITVGTPHTLDSIELAAGINSGTNEIDVWLMSDDAGEPGAIIETFNFQNLPHFGDGPILVGNSALNPILTPGINYWLVASAPHENDTFAGWNASLPAVSGPIAFRLGAGEWNVINDTQPAYRINGSPVVIPAPAAILLGGIGASLVGWMKRRRTL